MWRQDQASYLAAIVASSDDAVVSKTLDGTIQSWNQAATEMYGYTAEEAIGQPIDIVIPEDRLDEERDIRRRLARGERIDHQETVRRRKDKSLFEVSLSISPVRDAAGHIVGAAGFARDISERTRMEIESYLAAIVASSGDAVVSKTLDGTIRSWNQAATEMYGYTAEEAIGQPIDIVIPEDRLDEERDIRRRLARGERIDHQETVRRRKDKSLFEVSLSISPIRDATGHIVGAAGFARDVSVRKRMEFESYLAAIVDSSDESVVSMTADGTIRSWNQAATEMYGYTAEEAIDQPIDIVIPDEDHLFEERKIQRRLAEGERIDRHETKHRQKNGRLIDISRAMSPVLDAAGNLVGAASFVRDITETKRIQALLANFVKFAAHDFSRPMVDVKKILQEVAFCLDDRLVGEERSLMDLAMGKAEWIIRHVDALKKYSNIDDPETQFGLVDTETVFDEVVATLQAADENAADSKITRGALPAVVSDRHLLSLVFQNLIDNAIKLGLLPFLWVGSS